MNKDGKPEWMKEIKEEDKIKEPCPFCKKSEIQYVSAYTHNGYHYPSSICCDACDIVIHGKTAEWWNKHLSKEE